MIFGQRAINHPSLIQGGVQVSEPPREGAAPVWYDPVGAFDAAGFLGDIYAWRAINTPGSPWGAGPANYAATLTDENNGQVITPGGGYDGSLWAGATGWGFVAALAQWLDTGLIPANDQSWSMFVQFSSVPAGIAAHLAAGLTAGSGNFGLYIDNIPGIRRIYFNGAIGSTFIPGANTTAGNMGISGVFGYYNGVFEAGPPGVWAGASTKEVYIGCQNTNGVALNFITADIAAVWICTSNPATVQANAATLATAMGQL
jgi:hypothetical protein